MAGNSPLLTSTDPSVDLRFPRVTGTSPSSSKHALDVAILDGSGNQITSFGGGTQYAEDTPHVSGDTVTMAGVVQQSTDAALSGDGDRSLLQVDESGFLKVNVKAGSTAGTQYTEGDTDATITGTAVMWEDTSDTLRPVSAAKPLPVNVVSGGTSGTEYTEDTASVADPVGGQIMARRRDTLSSETTTDGDVTALNSTAKGELYVKHVDAIPVTDNGGSLTIDGSVTVAGITANSVDSNNSSTTPLGSGATFTGTATDALNYQSTDIFLATDRSGTLHVDHSSNGTNWDRTESYTITVTSPGTTQGYFFQMMTEGRYYRIRYVNGGTAQGVFRLQAILNAVPGTAEVHAISYPITSTTDALTTKGVIYGETTGGGGGYVAMKVNPSGSVEVGTVATVTTITNPVTVTATNLDIRDLSSATDSVTVTGTVSVNEPVSVDDNGGSLTVDGTVAATQSGGWTVTANAGTNLNTSALALDATLTNKSQFTKITDGTDTALVTAAGEINVLATAQPGVDIGDVTINNASGASAVNIQDGGNSITVDGTVAATQSGTWNIGTVTTVTNVVHVDDNSSTLSIDDGGGSITVDGTVTTSLPTAASSSVTSVAGSASSVSLLASNASRKMATFMNDSSATAYLKLGATASTSSYTVLMRPYDYYELPSPVYTGAIDAIWDSAAGNMRITELS